MMVALLAAAMLIQHVTGRPAEAGRYVVNVVNDPIPVASGFSRTSGAPADAAVPIPVASGFSRTSWVPADAPVPIPVASGFSRTAFRQPDYAALYDQGISYERFLAGASVRAEEWRRNSKDALVAEEALRRVRTLEMPRRVLVVTEASCSDSVATIPYLAQLVEQAPDRLEMRLVTSKAGRAVMEAHRTPDGRAATPTVIVLDGEGRFVAAWIERPAALQQWHAEHNVTNTTRALLPAKMQWYADDAGRSTIAELVAALTAR